VSNILKSLWFQVSYIVFNKTNNWAVLLGMGWCYLVSLGNLTSGISTCPATWCEPILSTLLIFRVALHDEMMHVVRVSVLDFKNPKKNYKRCIRNMFKKYRRYSRS
jgi:hypothetical protein